ncbi:GAF and ANTAR domain-containing protein [Rhodococcus sp. BP-252]|uniref:GAF and ANTAR domain-containing protein n=1 Tax=unclassified Rhodococcus (in: high G+C Gram-positive bacteria) TaxID=192944 RepID=UPI001C9B9429|nr:MULTISPECIES: GAF and ANTAR domain-containing protein [unclassified Rhodococcus (in: high G+C Gram-positive bacteria)]MBY6412317.1 GAF and ANTAR domain-containing protein [Rhodococcus sp. BP-320]MBY6416897.1 GAF and ANTAR domain-containing protein [Rhodococcus sp. BP-321]MBY6421565.1 GAF and ANTAR domain-containing protein [Rhodococcus sp. BP-324]MBY6426831.1 GAF and ANTAR domain-containing protein [Rhodococcus sp. BP-323]MBY6431997.1 GAF and ANTAR domain-containing protein [Rhodococcus sp.
MNDNAQHLHSQIAELARSIHTSGDPDPSTEEGILDDVTTWAAKFMTAVDHAGVSLIHRHNKKYDFEAVAPTGDIPRFIDQLQDRYDAGPCLDAIRSHGTVLVQDFGQETRWPLVADAIVDQTPVRSSLSMLLYTDTQSIGALNLYSETPDAFDQDTIEQAEALATHVAVGISRVRRDEQFKSALASRDMIGQAKGMIMGRFSIDALQAFRLLSRLSQDRNIPVTEIAKQLVEAGRET